MNRKAVVLISGCSSGIGLALAREFSSRGCRVFATARKPGMIRHLKKEGMETFRLDVTDTESIDACVKAVIAKAGRIDVLVNNAGYALIGPVIDLSIDDMKHQFDTNVIGLVALTKAVAPHMIKKRSGLIVNIASVSGICATPFAGAYCASKAAVNLLSVSLRIELAPFGIDVVTVQPGAIKSGFGKAAADSIHLAEKSVYKPIDAFVQARAYASQQDPTPAEVFSKKLIDRLSGEKIPKIIRLGKSSARLPQLAKLPTDRFDKMMIRGFGLDRLKK